MPKRCKIFPMKLCTKFYGSVLNNPVDKFVGNLVFEVITAIKKCKNIKQLDPKKAPIVLGEGTYGLVVSDDLKFRGKVPGISGPTINVAIKIQTVTATPTGTAQENLDALKKEIYYAELLGKLNLGPKIYKKFFYLLKDNDGVIRHEYRVVFIMERFHIDAHNMIFSGYRLKRPIHQVSGAFKQMLDIIEKVSYNNIFCRDVKPSNFVVNINNNTGKVIVRMIDFGGDFCEDMPPRFIRTINKYAAKQIHQTSQPKLKTIFRDTQKKGEHYPWKLFSRVIQVSLILQVFNKMMGQLKSNNNPVCRQGQVGVECRNECVAQHGNAVGYCRYIKGVMLSAYPIVHEICHTDSELYNITEAIINSNRLYGVFIHYVRPSKRGLNKKLRREIVLREFQNICLLDKWGAAALPPGPPPSALALDAMPATAAAVPPAAVSAPAATAATILHQRAGSRMSKRTRRRKRKRTRRRKRKRTRSTRKKRH